MENEKQERALVPTGDLFWDVDTFEHGQRVAKALITSQMVPERFRNVGDVLISLNMSRRMEQVTGNYIDPLMMMQNIYIIKGKPAFETRLAIGFFNALKTWERINWQVKWRNEDKWQTLDEKTAGNYQFARAFAKHLKDDKTYYGEEVSVRMAQSAGWWGKSGSLWPVMTGMMLRYRSAMFFIRQFEPGVLLGLYTREEILDMEETEPGVYQVPEETVTRKLLEEVEPEPEMPETTEVKVEPEFEDRPLLWLCQDCGKRFKEVDMVEKTRCVPCHQAFITPPEDPDPEPEVKSATEIKVDEFRTLKKPGMLKYAEEVANVDWHTWTEEVQKEFKRLYKKKLEKEYSPPSKATDPAPGPTDNGTTEMRPDEIKFWDEWAEKMADLRMTCFTLLGSEKAYYDVLGENGYENLVEVRATKNQALASTIIKEIENALSD